MPLDRSQDHLGTSLFTPKQPGFVDNYGASLRRVAEFIGIAFDPILLTPTFLRNPVRPNSSFDVETYGINAQMIDRRDKLSPQATRALEAAALPTYRELVRRHGLAGVAA